MLKKPSLSDRHPVMTDTVSVLKAEAEQMSLLKIFPVLFRDIKILVVQLGVRAGLFDAGVTDLVSAFFTYNAGKINVRFLPVLINHNYPDQVRIFHAVELGVAYRAVDKVFSARFKFKRRMGRFGVVAQLGIQEDQASL